MSDGRIGLDLSVVIVAGDRSLVYDDGNEDHHLRPPFCQHPTVVLAIKLAVLETNMHKYRCHARAHLGSPPPTLAYVM